MSLVLDTLKAFPRGVALEQLLVLVDCADEPHKRRAVQTELDELVQAGLAFQASNHKWRAVLSVPGAEPAPPGPPEPGAEPEGELLAAPARFSSEPAGESVPQGEGQEGSIDPQALLRYWRAALRADPRGAITQTGDRHGASWHLLTGTGPPWPENEGMRVISVDLDALKSGFRQALAKRDANEQSLAVGWPIAVGRKDGVPAVWPVGLLAAEWRRTETDLEITVEADDILVNPDWIKGGAAAMGWQQTKLREAFSATESVGLPAEDFVTRLREIAAGHHQGRLSGERLAFQIDINAASIHDIVAVFLPSDTTFTAGAVRDLDSIAEWPKGRLARTALAPVLGIEPDLEAPDITPVLPHSNNAEQIAAVRNACAAPLSVVTGPPGTGKSRTIVSIAATVMAHGGNVLVASKNHQALDAVMEHLDGLAPSLPIPVRTLDPEREVDRSLEDVMAELVSEPSGQPPEPDEFAWLQIGRLSRDLTGSLDTISRIAEGECEMADLAERIDARTRDAAAESGRHAPPPPPAGGILTGIWRWIRRLAAAFGWSPGTGPSAAEAAVRGAPLDILRARQRKLRDERRQLAEPDDPVALSAKLVDLARDQIPRRLEARTTVREDARLSIAQRRDDLEFSGARTPGDLARTVIDHRPLWLASILGAPRRIPLHDGLFDIAIFDEASQCDIASALPLLARARRAVVVGDRQQLNFIAQLGRATDRNLMQSLELPVERMGRFAQSMHSLFDFASRIPDAPRVMLRHQYRSAGPIVDYISEEFYGGRLVPSRDPSGLVTPRSQKPGIAWTDVKAPAVYRDGNANRNEARAIAEHLGTLLMKEGYAGTIGVIAPFRRQVHTLDEAIRGSIPAQKLEGAEFRVATVDGFQGQERDLILFSPCLGPASPASAITFLQRDLRRLNVAVSRARAVTHVFGDLEFARSAKIRALARLASAATEPQRRAGEGVFDSEWERRVFHALKGRGLDPKPQYDLAGLRLDFALFGKGGVKLDVEVDGRHWHQDIDGNRKMSDHWRDHRLRSMGWRVRRFWVDQLAQDMEGCLERIELDLSP